MVRNYLSDRNRSKPFTHRLVPKHVIVSSEEARLLLDKFRIKPSQLPILFTSDPMAKQVKAKPGDIVKIIRKSPTAGESIAYRYVIEG